MAYEIGTLPLERLVGPATRANELLARLDERLAHSPVRDGWIERSHFRDAVAALWVEGELVHVEDLVFHDAEMDQRPPTHELTRAHVVLRKRRRILSQGRDWTFSRDGLRELTGRVAASTTIAEGDRVGEGMGSTAADSVGATDEPEEADDDAEIIFGSVIDETLKDEVRVTVIATGFNPVVTKDVAAEVERLVDLVLVEPRGVLPP